jgi:hypothetical protein
MHQKHTNMDINEQKGDYSQILEECARIAKERQEQYGSANDSITLAAKILDETFGIKLTPKEFCFVMVALKLSREKFNPKRDNILDSINYLAIAANFKEDKNI